jgi:hypothetical protein
MRQQLMEQNPTNKRVGKLQKHPLFLNENVTKSVMRIASENSVG